MTQSGYTHCACTECPELVTVSDIGRRVFCDGCAEHCDPDTLCTPSSFADPSDFECCNPDNVPGDSIGLVDETPPEMYGVWS